MREPDVPGGEGSDRLARPTRGPSGLDALQEALDGLIGQEVQRLRGLTEAEPLTKDKLIRAYEAERDGRSFLSVHMHAELANACRDPLFNQAWTFLTSRVRDGLNDHIVNGIINMLKHMIRDRYVERDMLNTRNLDNIRKICGAAREVVKGYEDAVAKGDPVYMEQVIEELESAVVELTGKDVFDG